MLLRVSLDPVRGFLIPSQRLRVCYCGGGDGETQTVRSTGPHPPFFYKNRPCLKVPSRQLEFAEDENRVHSSGLCKIYRLRCKNDYDVSICNPVSYSDPPPSPLKIPPLPPDIFPLPV